MVERVKRKIFVLFLIFYIGGSAAPVSCANNYNYPPLKTTLPPISQISSPPPPVAPQPVDFGNCNKFFKMDSRKLFYLTLAGANANRFRIDEIQSKSAYVLFTVAQRQFLASVITIDSQNSMLKITPCNNIYYFPAGIVQNMFKYIELNTNTPIEKLGVLSGVL
ncbi:MAG: hypothetical protein WCY19_05745 [Candidatus Gastranaerophilaceae bacterium]